MYGLLPKDRKEFVYSIKKHIFEIFIIHILSKFFIKNELSIEFIECIPHAFVNLITNLNVKI